MIYGFNYTKQNREYVPGRYAIQRAIVPDIGVLHYLSEVAPVLDANMFVIYGNENNYDTSELTVKDLTELSSIYSRQIRAFVVNKIRKKITQIISRWDSALKKLDLTISLSEPIYRQFMSASKNVEIISYKFNNINTEAVVAVLQSVRNQFIMNTSTHRGVLNEDIPVDPEYVSKFFGYILDFNRLALDKVLQDQSQYQYINKSIISISVSLLNMIVSSASFTKHFTIYDNPDTIFDELFVPYFNSQPKAVKEYTRKCRALQMAHVVCLDTTWVDSIIMPRTPIYRDNSSSKFAAMLMMSNGNDDTIAKVAKIANRGACCEDDCPTPCEPVGGY